MVGIRFRSARRSRGVVARCLIAVVSWCLTNIRHVIKSVNPTPLLRKWQHRRYGNRYTVDKNGSVIYRPSILNRFTDYIGKDTHAKRKLLEWVQKEIPEFRISDFGSCWSDGIALCALLESQCPGACPRYDLLRPSHKINNCRLALKTAFKHLSIPFTLLSAEDLATFSVRYQDSIQKLISLIKWASSQKALRDVTKDEGNSEDPAAEKPSQKDTSLIKLCFASGCGLAVGLVGRRCKFDVYIPTTELLDLFVAIRGSSGSTSHVHITELFPKVRNNSIERVPRDRRAIALWKLGASKVLTARGRRAVMSSKFQCPSISEEPKISIDYQIIKEGHISISYMPHCEGVHTMVLKWHNRQFIESPYKIRISDTIENLNKNDIPPVCLRQIRFGHTLKNTPAYMSLSTCDPIEEIEVKKDDKTRDINVCGVAAAVLNRTSKVQRSISRIGIPASGSVPKQAVVRKRRVLKRVITSGGQEIVIQEAAPTPPMTSPETSLDVEQREQPPSANTEHGGKRDDQKCNELQQPNGTVSSGAGSVKQSDIQPGPIEMKSETLPSKPTCLTIPTGDKTLYTSPFSKKLESPSSPDKARVLSIDSPTPDNNEFSAKTESAEVTKTEAQREPVSSPVINNDIISKRQSRHSVSDSRPMLKKSPSKNKLRTSFSLPTLRRTWTAFDIEDDTLSPSEMEARSISAQRRQKRATLSVVELNNIVNDFSTVLHDSKYITEIIANDSEKDSETDNKNKKPVGNTPLPEEDRSSKESVIKIRQSESVENLRQNLPINVKIPKAKKDKWTQVSYETITAETGWRRPTTYVRPRRRAIYAKKTSCSDLANQGPVSTRTGESHDSERSAPRIPDDVMTSEQSLQISLSEDQTPGTNENSNRETNDESTSTNPRRPTRFPAALSRPKLINGHKTLRRFLYRGKIALDPKLTSNIPRTPTPVEDNCAYTISRSRRLRSLNSRSSSEGKRSNVTSSRECTPEVECRYLPRLRRRSLFKKKVKFSKRVLIHNQSSSRSSRNSKQSNEDTSSSVERQTERQAIADELLSKLQVELNAQETQPKTLSPLFQREKSICCSDNLYISQLTNASASRPTFPVTAMDENSSIGAKKQDSIGNHISREIHISPRDSNSTNPAEPEPMKLSSEDGIDRAAKMSRCISCPTKQQSFDEHQSINLLPNQEGPSRVAQYLRGQSARVDRRQPDMSSKALPDGVPNTDKYQSGNSPLDKLLDFGSNEDSFFDSWAELGDGSNYQLDLVPRSIQIPDPFKCKAFGPGLHHGTVGAKNMFQVSAPTTGNGALCVSVTGPRPRTVQETSVMYTGDYLYEVTFEGSRPGVYLIHVRWGDLNIPDSPFVCQMEF